MFTFRLDIFHHFSNPAADAAITQRLDDIMTTQAELALQIAALTEQNDKARAEILAKIAAMQAALDAAANVDPAVIAAFDALKASVQVDDDIVADPV